MSTNPIPHLACMAACSSRAAHRTAHFDKTLSKAPGHASDGPRRTLPGENAAAGGGLACVEEPLFGEWQEEMAELTAYSRVPVAGGELHVMGYRELARVLKMGCYDIYRPDAIWADGIAQSLQVAGLCREQGLAFTPHCWSNGFGSIANALVFAASGFAGEALLDYPVAPPGWTPEARDMIFREPFLHENGWFVMPEAPRLGFDIDPAALSRYGHCFFKGSRRQVHWMSEAISGV